MVNKWRNLELSQGIISDVLPFEMPVFFSNTPLFYLSFNANGNDKICNFITAALTKIAKQESEPYQFQAQSGSGKLRNLSLMHFSHQLFISHFLAENKDFFLEYNSNINNTSLRYVSHWNDISDTEVFNDLTATLGDVSSSRVTAHPVGRASGLTLVANKP